jgi:hypothetical protein
MVEPTTCVACGDPVFLPDSEYCLVHWGIKAAVDKAEGAMAEQDVVGAVTGGLMAIGLQILGPTIQQAQKPQAAQPPPRPRQRPEVNPFDVLGLDPKQATKEDVKRVQKQLARIYHNDQDITGLAAQKMAQINAAADTCIKFIENRKK